MEDCISLQGRPRYGLGVSTPERPPVASSLFADALIALELHNFNLLDFYAACVYSNSAESLGALAELVSYIPVLRASKLLTPQRRD